MDIRAALSVLLAVPLPELRAYLDALAPGDDVREQAIGRAVLGIRAGLERDDPQVRCSAAMATALNVELIRQGWNMRERL